jgi:DNA-binding transcriptional LysR family regulator
MGRDTPLSRRDRITTMTDWDKMRIFHAVAEAGSFTHAGETLTMSQSAVSRQISALEDDLGVSLFHRHARGLVLTEEGETLFHTAQEMMVKLQAVRSRLTDSKERPSGVLRVHTTVGLGSTWLALRLKEFSDLYPEIQLDLFLSDEELDLSMRAADVSIRLRQPTQPNLIQRKLFTVHFHLYASPDYLKRHGQPQSLEELDNHRLISFGNPTPNYLQDINFLEKAGLPDKQTRPMNMRINNIAGLRNAVRRGAGIAMLPDYINDEQTSLVQIPMNIQCPSFSAYFVYPEELRHSMKVMVFRDFLVSKAQRWSF